MKRIQKQNQQPATEKQVSYLNSLVESFNTDERYTDTFGKIVVSDDLAGWEASNLIDIFRTCTASSLLFEVYSGYTVKNNKRFVTDRAAALRALNTYDEMFRKLDEKGKIPHALN